MLMASTWEIHRGDTAAIPEQYRGDTLATPGREWCRAPGGHPGGRPILTRLELHPAGLLPLPEPSAHGALAPEHESPRSQQPRMKHLLCAKGPS
jgi:hypothetical protein